jgi:ribosomal protein S18 acetylase RimI-like enzyme
MPGWHCTRQPGLQAACRTSIHIMEIREYQESDQQAVIALWHDCALVVPWNDPAKDIARKLQVNRDLFLVGLDEHRIVATAMGGYDGHRGWVNYLAVRPMAQRRGYGRELMKALESRMRILGCPKINLQIRSGNRAILAFYGALGYTADDVISLGKRLENDTRGPV